MILIMMGLGFLCKRNILERLKQKIIFALMCLVTKTSWFFQFTFQIKNFKLNGFVAYNCLKQVTLRVYKKFWRIYFSQNKE